MEATLTLKLDQEVIEQATRDALLDSGRTFLMGKIIPLCKKLTSLSLYIRFVAGELSG